MHSGESNLEYSSNDAKINGRCSRIGGLLLGTTIVLACAFWGYQLSFSIYQGYDDEGYVMMSLHNVMNGKPLYDETYSQYGPAFFQIQSFFHTATQLPIAHDVTRWKTLAQWLLIAGLTAFAVYRVTRSFPFFCATFAFIFLHIDRITLEPGHPQEWCALLVAVMILLTTFVKPTRRPAVDKTSPAKSNRRHWIFAAIGILTAIVLMTKVNVGLLLLLPLACAMLVTAPRTEFWKYLSIIGIGIALALPLLLTVKHGFHPVSSAMPQLVIIATVSIVLACFRQRADEFLNLKRMLLALVGLAGTIAIVLLIALTQGTTTGGLLEGLVLQHSRFSDVFFLPPPLSRLAIPVAIAGLIGCVLAMRGNQRIVDLARIGLLIVLSAAGITYVVESFSAPLSGTINRGMAGLLCSFAPSLVWVVLWPAHKLSSSKQDLQDQTRFARAAICFIAVFQPLVAYPLPGTQMAVGSFVLLAAGLIAVWDLKRELPVFLAARHARMARLMPIGCLLVLAVTSLLIRDGYSYHRRQGFSSVELPGTNRLRLSERQKREIHDLANSLKTKSDTFIFAENTRNSYYFWTDRMPPTGYNGTIWPYMLSHDLQHRTMDSLNNYERVVVVRDVRKYPLPDDSPLLNYIDKNFEMEKELGPFEVWTVKSTNDQKLVTSLHTQPR